MITAFLWYLAISLLGWAAFPVAFRLLPSLPDRGYAFTRILGLLLWGYIFWLLASFGILQNNTGGLLLALLIVFVLAWWSLRGTGLADLRAWLRTHWRLVLSVELITLLAFTAWVIVRAANPEIAGTEKPMELAFINAILRSDTFPPHDPWLSGYAISYYYFGYVIVAMLARLVGAPGSIAFNLAIATAFTLSATGAYGCVYNLLARRYPEKANRFTLPALLGSIFVLLVSNLEGFLHVLHTRGLLWVKDAAGQLTSPFWKWLDIKDLNMPPAEPFSWAPTQFWWWWRASRVIQDYDFAGGPREIINEFPFFSYLLADLHPHVLAMPFAFLAMAIALNVYLSARDANPQISWWPYRLLAIRPAEFFLAAILLGGMAFLNTWDLPVYLVLFAAAYAFARESAPRLITWLRDFMIMALAAGLTGIFLYLPFYLSFSSQAGGPLPNLIYPTRGAHLWVMFGAFLIPVFAFLAYLYSKNKQPGLLRRGFGIGMGVLLALWVLSLLFGMLILLLPELGDLFLGSLAAPDGAALLRKAITRRFASPGGWITLLLLLGVSFSLVLRMVNLLAADPERDDPSTTGENEGHANKNQADLFSLLLITLGALLVLGIEFFYLRDQFGWRMNTIFKFYFQSWHLWAVAAAYAVCVLLWELRSLSGSVFRIGMVILLLMALVYPTMSLWSKTNGFQPVSGWTLDGTAFLESSSPDEMAAARWLEGAPFGVVAEAVDAKGGSYKNYARISMLSGLPTVLGWMGHESQWRGGNTEMGTRQPDLERLYCSRDWQETQSILDSYNIRYIIIGNLERSTYAPGSGNCLAGLQETKFYTQLSPVFQQGSITIYEYISRSSR